MASPTVNVVRYTALASGIFYGIVHRRTLQTKLDNQRAHEEELRHERLVNQAKEAWRKKNDPSLSQLVTDPDDPKFDVEKLIAKYEADSK
ncbi:ATP synthase E chain domain-containing protein [Ceratobasidium sp. AG-Ba]|nr:ATP synthase E chain domain-containing protein [Ceratobasidium sp. AG-Ba]QRV94639.1 ATP synthase E chain domain-containing protein [Ceratobasidium sp. AG-Ba]QRW08950.1 ATP synthase E chain domain-containing protein [Ceratobasidium sp. AG-Ba]